MKNPYDVLGVAHDASAADIRAAYRQLARQHHPDREGGNATTMAAVNEAYAILSDAERRAKFDASGTTEQDHGQQRARAAIAELAARYLEQGDGNAIQFVANTLERSVAVNQTNIAAQCRTIAKLQKQIERYTHKGQGVNLFAAVAQQRIDQLRSANQQCGEALETAQAALQLLQDYEYTAPDESAAMAPAFIQWHSTHTTAGATAA